MINNSAEESKIIVKNILKCRDDHKPVLFTSIKEPQDSEAPEFKLLEASGCSWAKSGETFGPDKLRPRIEPWLTALCQSEHLSLLLGSGLSHAVHRLGTGKMLPGMGKGDFGDENDVINAEAARSANITGRGDGNIEDQIRAANELLRGLEILSLKDKDAAKRASALRLKLTDVLATFANDILLGEQGVIEATDENRELAFNYLVSFLMSFASRTGTRDRLNIFTTNYDRFIEAGAEASGMHLLDRFVGSLAPIFRSSRLDLDMHYNPPGIRGEPRYLEGVARFTKLHGSLDWVEYNRNIRRAGVPFGATGINQYLKSFGSAKTDAMRLMVYPNAAKDRETALYPYVELFRDFAAAACRPNHTLIAFGYSFGDEHINRIIEDMLTIPSTHLVVISYDDPLGRIIGAYEKIGRHAQISLLIGDHVGGFQSLIDNYLPKPAIDRTTFRMAELLKSRWGTNQDEKQHTIAAPTTQAEDEI
ncbi:MAG: fibronectin-binding protein (FBP) [Desulfobulbaceae bacterium]|nr:MAG: fibronectin-binding protein (FBP) [Desulfobulbaceae bacterium]